MCTGKTSTLTALSLCATGPYTLNIPFSFNVSAVTPMFVKTAYRFEAYTSLASGCSVGTVSATIPGPAEAADGDKNGYSLAWLGDIDGNSRSSSVGVLASGAPRDDEDGRTNIGAVHLMYYRYF